VESLLESRVGHAIESRSTGENQALRAAGPSPVPHELLEGFLEDQLAGRRQIGGREIRILVAEAECTAISRLAQHRSQLRVEAGA